MKNIQYKNATTNNNNICKLVSYTSGKLEITTQDLENNQAHSKENI